MSDFPTNLQRVAQFGSASAWGAEGRWFKSTHADKMNLKEQYQIYKNTKYDDSYKGRHAKSDAWRNIVAQYIKEEMRERGFADGDLYTRFEFGYDLRPRGLMPDLVSIHNGLGSVDNSRWINKITIAHVRNYSDGEWSGSWAIVSTKARTDARFLDPTADRLIAAVSKLHAELLEIVK